MTEGLRRLPWWRCLIPVTVTRVTERWEAAGPTTTRLRFHQWLWITWGEL